MRPPPCDPPHPPTLSAKPITTHAGEGAAKSSLEKVRIAAPRSPTPLYELQSQHPHALLRRHVKLFTALALMKITAGEPLAEIGAKFGGVDTQTLLNLQGEATKFCSMVAAFCQHLNWDDLAVYIAGFKVSHCRPCDD